MSDYIKLALKIATAAEASMLRKETRAELVDAVHQALKDGLWLLTYAPGEQPATHTPVPEYDEGEATKLKSDDARDFPRNTCPASRHVQLVAERLLAGADYCICSHEDTRQVAESMDATVAALWKLRSEFKSKPSALDEIDAAVDPSKDRPHGGKMFVTMVLSELCDTCRSKAVSELPREDKPDLFLDFFQDPKNREIYDQVEIIEKAKARLLELGQDVDKPSALDEIDAADEAREQAIDDVLAMIDDHIADASVWPQLCYVLSRLRSDIAKLKGEE